MALPLPPPARFPPLLALLHAAFDAARGPVLRQHAPADLETADLSPDLPLLLPYLIPRRALCNRVVAVRRAPVHILGFPVLVHDEERYARNEFTFNIAFVLLDDATGRAGDVACWEPVVRRCAAALRRLEMERGFMSDPESADSVQLVLEQMFADFNAYHECRVPVDVPILANDINAAVVPYMNEASRVVHDWDVPLLVVQPAMFTAVECDLTLAKLVPHLDGVLHVSRAATEADVNLDAAKICISELVRCGAAVLIDIFQFSNAYAVLPGLRLLADDVEMQRKCTAFISRPGFAPPQIRTVIGAYASLRPGLEIGRWLEDTGIRQIPAIDIRRLIAYGVAHGIIRRVRCYPIPQDPAFARKLDKQSELRRLLNAAMDYDAICVALRLSRAEVQALLQRSSIPYYDLYK